MFNKHSLLLALLAGLAGTGPLWGLSIELRNISNDQLFTGIEFSQLGDGNNTAAALQYLKIEYPEVINQDLRLYTNNLGWRGAAGRAEGLVSRRSNTDTIPLYWMSFSSPQPGGIQLTEADLINWNKVVDLNSPVYAASRRSANLPLHANNTSYIYFATHVSSDTFLGDYFTNLVTELVSPVPDILPPILGGLNCNEAPRTDPVIFETVIRDDFEVKAATFHFRARGETAYSARNMTLIPSPNNSFEWTALALIPQREMPLGSYEYFIEADDGNFRGFYGNADAPHPFIVVDELAEFSSRVSPAGAFLAANACARQAGAPELIFPAGAISGDTTITIRRVLPHLMVTHDGASAISAFEFGPKGLHFSRPVTLNFRYSDADQNGLVDGTGIPEEELKVFWFDGLEWRNMGGRVDIAANVVRTEINHFSIYGLFQAGHLTADAVRPREKIITPNSDGVNDFAQFGISGDFEISIFDIQGSRVRKLENLSVWDGRMDDGRSAHSGIYIYQVRSSQLEKTVSGTLGVAR
ncbi:MAG: hypothetical protein A2901_04665 [Elusimicrobia bacterium RIFCSPLOWO2_01_FULL_54_10]|nr:MAG: hypothetical protein A2901_04665 [Elusimicrobia bacterium RIFCSPLOWO2_01_FULL_54_10]